MEVEYAKEAAKFIRKSKKNKKLWKEIKEIDGQLRQGGGKLKAEKLSGQLKFLRVCRFKQGKMEFRLVFTVEDKVVVWQIGPRENFYKKLLKKFG